MEQETLLVNGMASEEVKVSKESSEFGNVQQKTSEVMSKEESSQDCLDNHVQSSVVQDVQNVLPDVKVEEKIQPILSSKPEDQIEDEVFIPISTSQVIFIHYLFSKYRYNGKIFFYWQVLNRAIIYGRRM